MILIDTSAWIEYLRATGSAAAIEVRRLLSTDADRVVMCEPIAMEIERSQPRPGRVRSPKRW